MNSLNHDLLGIPDGRIAEADDNDPYVTKIGGIPVWFESDQPPPSDIAKCGVCGRMMYLLFQGYVPLPDSVYHRNLYVWGCNRRKCMRKPGSFSALRSHLVDPEYKQAQLQKKEKQLQMQKQKAVNPFGQAGNFQLGDLWNTTDTFALPSIPVSHSISMISGSDQASLSVDALSSEMKALDINTTKISDGIKLDTCQLPKFPGEYLYIIDEKNIDSRPPQDIVDRYKDTIDMESGLMDFNTNDEDADGWGAEKYEKQKLPKGVDKFFKKFLHTVQQHPSQCIRYQRQGTPLLYCGLDVLPTTLTCQNCGGPCLFELQLMPNILALFPVMEMSEQEEPIKDNKKTPSPDQWSVGMEFGTILLYVCAVDCHPGDDNQVSYVKEHVIVQYEQD